jgi:DNA-binding IclR family transcriptional regulator
MVKSADRVIKILEITASKNDGMTHGQIAAELSIPKGSLSKLLSNLVAREYLSVDERRKLYRLGPQVLVLTGKYLSSLDIVQLGRPIVDELTKTTNESTEIHVLKNNEVMIVCKADCSRPLVRSISVGDTYPAYATSGGKAILAHLSQEDVERYFSSVKLVSITKKTTTDPALLRREFRRIRAEGIAYGREEVYEGISGMASPIFAVYGEVLGSIVIAMPASRFSPGKGHSLEKALRDASAKLSYHLGFDTSSNNDKGRN